MADVKHGTVVVTVANHLTPDDRAGSMNPKEVQQLGRARRGVGMVCGDCADAIQKAGSKLTLPADVTPAALLAAGQRAEEIDQVILDLEVVVNKFKQTNLIFDAHAHELLGRVNDAVKAQGKQHPELLTMFQSLAAYFSNKRSTPPAP